MSIRAAERIRDSISKPEGREEMRKKDALNRAEAVSRILEIRRGDTQAYYNHIYDRYIG